MSAPDTPHQRAELVLAAARMLRLVGDKTGVRSVGITLHGCDSELMLGLRDSGATQMMSSLHGMNMDQIGGADLEIDAWADDESWRPRATLRVPTEVQS